MDKRIIVFVSLVILVFISQVVFISATTPPNPKMYALSEIKPQQTNSLNSGNGICEYFKKEFSIGEKNTITINGVTINIDYKGNKNWKINNYEGELKNHDFFFNNENSRLNGVRFDFSFMDQYHPDGNFGVSEQDYYQWDCQGYSLSTGLVSEVKIREGWNLVPESTRLRDCNYALEGELCENDVLVSYYYIPILNKYFSLKELEKIGEEIKNNPITVETEILILKEYLSEENEFVLMKSSKWIYVKRGSGNKRVINDFGIYIPNRKEILESGVFKLSNGWNFLYIDAFMVYDDKWNFNPLSIKLMKGSCNIEKAYLWDADKQDWSKIDLSSDIRYYGNYVGQGFVIKVTDNCNLGSSEDVISPPGLPLDELPELNYVNWPTTIGDYKKMDDNDFSPDIADGCASNSQIGEYCMQQILDSAYENNQKNEIISVGIIKITKGYDHYVDFYDSYSTNTEVNNIKKIKGKSIWWTSSDNVVVFMQDYKVSDQQSRIAQNTNEINEVVNYFAAKYPPKTKRK